MAKRKGSSASGPRTRSKAAKEGREEREVENAQGLDKLPQEVWDKILDNLDENDLFPVALSCRYFRQKQKELVARTRQSGSESGKPRLALKTNLKTNLYCLDNRQPASADYVRFCSKEKVSRDVGQKRGAYIRYLAAYHGHLPLLQELLKSLNTLDRDFITYAARGGQLETLRWLKTQKGFKLHEELIDNACAGGHLETLKWLRSEGCPWDDGACSQAALHGQLDVLKWLRSEGCPWDEEACREAAGNGELEVLRWLWSEGCPWSAWACHYAAWNGHLEILKWLRSEGCPWDERACEVAAKQGHLEVLKWLRSEREDCLWDPRYLCSEAAWNGHLEILKWLRSEGCPWDERVCTNAAMNGHWEIVRWLRSEGCPWDADMCRYAAEGGHLEVLKWLRSEGCPWDKTTTNFAAWRGHLDVLKWAIDNGCPYEVLIGTRPALEELGLA